VSPDGKGAGLALEKLLNELFGVFGLRPRQPFRVVGEQIDGSFELDGEIYLLESKWEKEALPEGSLLVFRGKIEGKSTFTRGVFIALNDISTPGRAAKRVARTSALRLLRPSSKGNPSVRPL
jgi:hypothetical protein